MEALGDKAEGVLDGRAGDLSAEAAETLVRDYLDQLGRTLALEAQIEWVYADPTVADPAAATAQAQTEVDALRPIWPRASQRPRRSSRPR